MIDIKVVTFNTNLKHRLFSLERALVEGLPQEMWYINIPTTFRQSDYYPLGIEAGLLAEYLFSVLPEGTRVSFPNPGTLGVCLSWDLHSRNWEWVEPIVKQSIINWLTDDPSRLERFINLRPAQPLELCQAH